MSTPSDTVYWKLAVPAKLVAGVNVTVVPTRVTVPLVAAPTAVMVMLGPSTSASLPSSAAAVSTSAVSSGVIAASSPAIGASGTGVTVTVAVPTAVRAPSDTVYWKLAVPVRLGAGVNVTMPAASATVPPLGAATAVTVSGPPSASVSLAARVAAGSASGVSSAVVTASATATGASGTGVTVTATVPVSVPAPSDTVYSKLAGPA